MNDNIPTLNQFFKVKKKTDDGELLFFEHYRLYVDSMEKLITRRQTAQSFFLTANASMLTLTGFLIKGSSKWTDDLGATLAGIAIAGILISFAWVRLHKSFFAMSTAKFHVIHALEAHLPAQLFLAEERALKDTKYKSMTKTESGVAYIFFLLYFVLLVFSIYRLIMWQ